MSNVNVVSQERLLIPVVNHRQLRINPQHVVSRSRISDQRVQVRVKQRKRGVIGSQVVTDRFGVNVAICRGAKMYENSRGGIHGDGTVGVTPAIIAYAKSGSQRVSNR